MLGFMMSYTGDLMLKEDLHHDGVLSAMKSHRSGKPPPFPLISHLALSQLNATLLFNLASITYAGLKEKIQGSASLRGGRKWGKLLARRMK